MLKKVWKAAKSFGSAASSILSGGFGDLLGLGAGLYGAEQSKDASKDIAKSRISWAVEDAKRAGVHPLYALGAAGANITPWETTGSAIADGISKFSQGKRARTAERIALQRAGYEARESEARSMALEAQAKRDLAAAQATQSQTARDAQRAMVSPTGVELVPVQVQAKRKERELKHIAAGKPPAFIRIDVPDGRGGHTEMDVPNPDLLESELTAPIVWGLAKWREMAARAGVSVAVLKAMARRKLYGTPVRKTGKKRRQYRHGR